MSGSFRQSYAELTNFISCHSEIEIGESVVSLPENVRPEFYNLFNAARDAFVQEHFPAYLDDALRLQEQFGRAEAKTKKLFSLEETAVVAGVQRFLQDPKGILTRELFDPLFDLLKARETIDSYEARAKSCIEKIFPLVFRAGYERWAILSLVELLDAERAFGVNVRSLNAGERAKPAAQAPLEAVPVPEESASFFFNQPRNAIFAVPDFIVHSSRLNRFIGVRSDFNPGLYNALSGSQQRTWQPIDIELLTLLENGLTLVYAAERAEDIALVADAANFCRPDLLLWCIDAQNLAKEKAMEIMTQANAILQPQLGSYVVANNSWSESCEAAVVNPQGEIAEPNKGVCILTVGYDQSKLKPVAEALASAFNETTTA